MAVINKNSSFMDFPLQIARQYGAPIDTNEVFYDMGSATTYATTSPLAYVGQIIKVVNEDSNTTTAYIIKDTAGNLDALGSSGDVSALTSRVSTLETEMDTAQGDITNLETKVGSAELDTTAKDLSAAINELKTDIDTLDGEVVKTSSASGQTITGGLTIAGDLTVNGTTTTVDQETLSVKDNLIITNSENTELGGHLSGIAINTGDSSDPHTYGMVYDPATDSVKLGLGTIGEDNEFTFGAGEGEAVVTRADSSAMTNGDLVQWDGTNNRVVTAGVAASELALKSELPSGFTITATSNLLSAVSGGSNSVTINVTETDTAVTGQLTKRTDGSLEFGGNIYANGTRLTGNTGTVTSVAPGEGLSGSTVTTTGTISHAVPSGATTRPGDENTGNTVIQDVTTDKFGHVTGVSTKEITATDLGAVTDVKSITTSATGQTAGQTESLEGTGNVVFHNVAKTGSYNDLLNKPTIPTELPNPNALTFGSKTYDGSEAATITAADLGALTAVPKATTSALGGIMLGYTATATNRAVELDTSGKAYVNVPAATEYTAGSGLSLSGGEFSIASLGVATGMIADNAVTTAKILDGNVTDAKIATVNANKLTQTSGDYLFINCGNAAGF